MLEYVLAHIVNYERNFYFNYDNQKTKIWDNSETRRFRIIPELTFGILGMGQIGNTSELLLVVSEVYVEVDIGIFSFQLG